MVWYEDNETLIPAGAKAGTEFVNPSTTSNTNSNSSQHSTAQSLRRFIHRNYKTKHSTDGAKTKV